MGAVQRTLAVLAALVAFTAVTAGCLVPDPADGVYQCASSGQQCPSGYSCIDGACYKNGHGPGDMGTGGNGSDSDMTDTTPAVLPSASTSSASVQPATAVANGVSEATVTIIVRDADGNPMRRATVFLTVSGTGNHITQPDFTDDTGTTTGRVSSTVAEKKTITAALGSASSEIVVTAPIEFTTPVPVNLLFSSQPSNGAPHAILNPPILVKAVDADNMPFTGPSVTITIALVDTATPTGAVLSGSLKVSTTQGVAKFDTLSIDKAGSGFKLTATAGALSATSSPFTVSDSLPSPPTAVTATNSNASTVTVTWTSPDVDHFELARSTVSGGPYTTIAMPTGTTKSYVDKTLLRGTYYYVVKAVTSVGASGGSMEASGESHQELCVANNTAGTGSVTVVSADMRDSALGSIRSFTNGLNAPFGLAASPGLTGQIFVANNGSTNNAAIYPRTEDAVGNNAAPVLFTGPASSALSAPTGIAYDATHDEIVVVSTGNNSIMGFPRSASGTSSPTWSIVGAATGLSVPEGVTVDGANGEVYVSNFGNSRILTFRRTDCTTVGSNCAPFRTWTNLNGSIIGPVGLYFDAGTLFIANQSGNSVSSFDTAHAIAAGASSPAATRIVAATSFSSPSGLVANATQMFVTNSSNVIVLPRTASGSSVSGQAITAGGVINGPIGIAFCN